MKNKYFSIGYSDATNNRYIKFPKLSPTLSQCHKGNEGVREKWHNYNYRFHWSYFIYYKVRQFPNTMRENIKKISTFLAWAVFTFLSHFSAKQFLSSSNHLAENVILLTSLQMAAGSVLYLQLVISRGGGGGGEVKIYASI